MLFVCRLVHLKRNFYCRDFDGVRSGGEFVNSAQGCSSDTEFLLESKFRSVENIVVDYSRSIPLFGSFPFLSNSSLPNANNFAEFIGDELRRFYFRKKRSAPDQSAGIQRALVCCCSHFNVLNVQFYPGFVRVAPVG